LPKPEREAGQNASITTVFFKVAGMKTANLTDKFAVSFI
jgi:hypothetical protein